MEIFKSSKKGLILGISTKEDGNMRIKENQIKFAKSLGFSNLKVNEQVHKDRVVRVGLKSRRKKADGLITNDKRIALGIIVADCLPVYLYNDKEIALIHCGWRGLSLNILQKAVLNMERKNLKALIGPGILFCHFKVKKDLLKLFPQYIVKKEYLDLQKIVKDQLGFLGIKDIIKIKECTFCSSKYFSFRSKDKQAMLALIGHKE